MVINGRRLSTLAVAVAAVAGLTGAIMASAPAVAAPTPHCVTVLHHQRPGELAPRPPDRNCFGTAEQAHASMADETLLMVIYSDTYYTGGDQGPITGDYGPCDLTGYAVPALESWWQTHISSFKVFNRCFYTSVYRSTQYRGDSKTFEGSTPWMQNFNDSVGSLRIRSAS